jgi:transcriptional regulator with XRE-family HTH domain
MISNYLKEYFKKNKITQYEIERRTGISQSKVNLSLNGKRKITAEELIKISIEFDINLEEIKKILRTGFESNS